MACGSQIASLVSFPDGIYSAGGKPWVCRHAAGAPHGVVYDVHFEPGRVRVPRRKLLGGTSNRLSTKK